MEENSKIFSSRSLTFSCTELPSSSVWMAVMEARLGEEELGVWLGGREALLVVDVEKVWLEGMQTETVPTMLLVMVFMFPSFCFSSFIAFHRFVFSYLSFAPLRRSML